MNEDTRKRIALFARDYIARFNELAPSLYELGPPVSLLPVPISVALVWVASDGAAIFYLSGDAAARLAPEMREPGVQVFEPPLRDLGRLLPALTFNNIKVTQPGPEVLRADLSNLPDPRQLPNVPQEETIWVGISPDMHAAIVDGQRTMVAMAVSPMRRYEGGRVVEELPTRVRIFSPIVDVGQGRSVRQYLWSFADALWRPELLDLSSGHAETLAQLDIGTLRLGMEGGLAQERLFVDPFEKVAEHIEDSAHRLEVLLDTPDVDEAAVQRFLEEKRHQFLVSPTHKEIFPRKALGHYVTDFAVLRADGEYHLVEIENPQRETFQKLGEEQSAALTHAMTQVMDWLRHVDENRDTVRRVDGLPTIYSPTGEVVAGRDSQLSGKARERFNYMRAQAGRVRLRTYDDLLREARAHAATLRRMKGAG